MVTTQIHRVDGHDVCRTHVEPSSRPVYARNVDGGTEAFFVRINGRTHFYNAGYADGTTKRPVDSDSLFNLGSVSKVFDVTLLSFAAVNGELSLDDPVAKYIRELDNGGDAGRITVRAQIPAVATTALMKKLQDTPIRVWLDPVKGK